MKPERRRNAKKHVSNSCGPKSPIGCKPCEAHLPKTLSGLVGRYLEEKYQHSLNKLLQRYSKIERLEDAVISAIRAEDLTKPGKGGKAEFKRHSHQYSIPIKSIEEAVKHLAPEILGQKFNSFSDLHACISKTCKGSMGSKGIYRLGTLYIYDTALRIGAHQKMKLEPDSVYLHAGAKDGAEALGLDMSHSHLPVERFPESMQKLKPYEIEDFLCIYNDEFKNTPTYRRS